MKFFKLKNTNKKFTFIVSNRLLIYCAKKSSKDNLINIQLKMAK